MSQWGQGKQQKVLRLPARGETLLALNKAFFIFKLPAQALRKLFPRIPGRVRKNGTHGCRTQKCWHVPVQQPPAPVGPAAAARAARTQLLAGRAPLRRFPCTPHWRCKPPRGAGSAKNSKITRGGGRRRKPPPQGGREAGQSFQAADAGPQGGGPGTGSEPSCTPPSCRPRGHSPAEPGGQEPALGETGQREIRV